uniref:Uncharacterized protein n=1 Tax=viral metagenome TaxID=1070528 RepID=A0A6C0JV87_9ZZZZ
MATPDDIKQYGKAIKRPIKVDKAVIAYLQEKFCMSPLADPELKVGYAMTSFIWYNIAKKVVESAISVYECSPEQAEALRSVYLRPGDYMVD